MGVLVGKEGDPHPQEESQQKNAQLQDPATANPSEPQIEQEGDQKEQKYIDQGLCTDHLLQTGGLQGAGGKAVVVPEEIQGVVQFERGKGDDKYGGHSQQRDQPVFEGLPIVAVDDHQDQQEQDQGPIIKEAGNADQDGGVKDLVLYPAYGL